MTSRFADVADRLRTALLPLREVAGRFVLPPPERDTIIGKAAVFVVSERIEGDYLEFGVFKGESLAKAYHALRSVYEREKKAAYKTDVEEALRLDSIWQRMRFVAFDSFEGLPELKGPDALTEDFKPGQFKTSTEEFWSHLKRRRVDPSKVITVEGWFQDTLNEETRTRLGLQKAAIVHIDSDLYESAKLALDFVTPLLQDGTILIFDDWFNFRGHPRLGEQRALFEWRQKNRRWGLTEYQKEGVRRNSFIVNDLSLEPDTTTT